MELNDLLLEHTKLIDKLEVLDAKYAAAIQPTKDKLKKIKAEAEKMFADSNQKTATANDGTNIHWKDVSKYKVVDKEAYFDFAMEQEEGAEFFTAAVPKKYIDDFTTETGSVPPGLEHNSSSIIVIKRSNK